ncbi:unnamed protein product [Musa textilis]
MIFILVSSVLNVLLGYTTVIRSFNLSFLQHFLFSFSAGKDDQLIPIRTAVFWLRLQSRLPPPGQHLSPEAFRACRLRCSMFWIKRTPDEAKTERLEDLPKPKR